tara:strand:+ start:4854 stop:5522 length:669 start_codon:yes stop_codon:yes gene_type:complete
MKVTLKKNGEFFVFYKNNELISCLKKKPLKASNSKHASFLKKELENKFDNDPYSVLNLSFFASNLDDVEKKEIANLIVKELRADLILYRYFEDLKLIKILSKNYDPYIKKFNQVFVCNLQLITKLFVHKKLENKNKNFFEFLLNQDTFYITALFKLVSLTKSVVLSYFFLSGNINYLKLFKLINLESKFQQDKWGYVDEQKKIDNDYIVTLKKISFFFKIIN